MPKVYLGSKDEPALDLQLSEDLIAVRTRSGRSIRRSAGPVPSPWVEELEDGALVASYPEAGVEVFRVPVGDGRRSLDARKTALRTAPDVRFAGGVLVDPTSQDPVLYTENLFIKFKDTSDTDTCRDTLQHAGLKVKQEVAYATNAFFVEAQEGTGRKVFDIANEFLQRPDVEFCHPELIRPRARKTIFPNQWHLKKTLLAGIPVDAHANVEAAHALTRGEGITIAIIDDGVDIDHPEFAGAGKVVAPRDATLGTDNPRPKDPFGTGPDDGENHGTACAGVACANGTQGASGVAPAARLMPIRLASGLGSQREADAFVWAADHGADVISCSWGPTDGKWWSAADPVHSRSVPMPASTRLAIDYVTAQGRGGKGCVVLFAAGNGNERVENDGYASHPKITAVAACNDTSRRSVYSDFGAAVWCSFPSSDFGHAPFNHPDPLTSGIWTTDRVSSAGYNVGTTADGDPQGMFTNSFGGTSSACPGAAGVAALVLSVNPGLAWNQVKELLRRACDRIDPQGGSYDANGRSDFYGYGRLNALKAVELAKPEPRNEVTVSRRFDQPIPDLQTVAFTLEVPDTTPVSSVSVAVDIKHTYVGDLVVSLEAPARLGIAPIVLHNRTGGSRNNLKRIYEATTARGLVALAGRDCHGSWTLRVQDAAAEDTGTLVTFSLRLSFGPINRVAEAPSKRSNTKVAKKVSLKTAMNHRR